MENNFSTTINNFLIKIRMSSESLHTVVLKKVCHSRDNKYTKGDLTRAVWGPPVLSVGLEILCPTKLVMKSQATSACTCLQTA